MQKKIFNIIIIGLIIISITGCGKTSNNSQKGSSNDDSKIIESTIHNVNEYKDGYALIDVSGELLSSIPYLVNENFEATFTWDFGANVVGSYVQTLVKDENEEQHIYDALGNKVFSYKEKEYEEVKLIPHGYLIIKKKNDTYNSSETTIGVYDLNKKEYIIEPTSQYNRITERGEYMFALDDSDKVFFNANLGKIVKFSKSLYSEFVNGYQLDVGNGYIKVYKDDGTEKNINYNVEYTSYNSKDAVANGYFSDVSNHGDKGYFYVVDLEKGTYKDFSDLFYHVTNKPKFTKDGYALVLFQNQGNVPYYTVIDINGKMKFEPVRVSDDNSYTSGYDKDLAIISVDNLVGDNYILLKNNSNALTELRDKDNNLIYKGDEDEAFVNLINNAVVVRYNYRGLDRYYFKDLNGNKIDIKIKINK